MRYWWVNQNQTYRHEVPGGYLWSPKRNRNGRRNPFYEFMREVAPGDIIFSFADTHIRAVGIAGSHAYEAPKPLEFGQAGANWEKIGWRVDVRFVELNYPVKPADHIAALRALFPERYAPLQVTGRGKQVVYLTLLPEALGIALVDLLGSDGKAVVQMRRLGELEVSSHAVGLAEWEAHQIEEVVADKTLPETTRKAVVLARRGQGLFKDNVQRIETRCRITGVDRLEHLRASHCKPWRDSSNEERLDGENGLLLTPDVDHLFDRGFISFEDDGKVLISPVADLESFRRMGLDESLMSTGVGSFSEGQRSYLSFHRDNVFLQRSAPRRERRYTK